MAKTNKNPDKVRIIRTLSKNADALRRFGVGRLGLFGSVASGRAKAGSDIDILVAFEPGQETFSNLIGLYRFLKKLLKGDIDLVTTGGLSPYLGPGILKEVEYIEGLS